MAQTATNVTAAKPAVGGALYSAPAGTTLPTDATTALGAAFVSLGYISEAGLTNANTIATDYIKAWGGDKVLPIATDTEETYSCTLLEALNLDVLKEIYGASNVTGTLSTGVTVKHGDPATASKVWAIDVVLRGGGLKRIVIPNGYLTDVGEITYSDSDALGYQITISAVADGSGNKAYEYVKKIASSV